MAKTDGRRKAVIASGATKSGGFERAHRRGSSNTCGESWAIKPAITVD